jgi:uncharacterized protein YwqG
VHPPPAETRTGSAGRDAFGIPHVEEILALARPSCRLITRSAKPDSLALGQSRFGGAPDVPPQFEWPDRGGKPLTFLAQLNLSEAALRSLPQTGWLLFFYDIEDQPWGYDPEDADGSRVVYVNASREALVRREPPAESPFPPSALSFEQGLDLPCLWDRRAWSVGEMSDEQWELMASEVTSGPYGPYHHLLGHPQLIQKDMREKCQLVAHGIYAGEPSAYKTEEAKTLLVGAAEKWELLLQLDSDWDVPEWVWGSFGALYFWIRRDDLQAARFDRTWLVLQTT